MSVHKTREQADEAGIGEVGDAVWGVILLVLSFAPAVAYELFPEGATETSKGIGFLTIYIATLPWSVAVTVVMAAAFAEKIPDGWAGLLFVGVVLIASQALGSALAPGAPDPFSWIESAGSKPWYVYLVIICVWIVLNYALLYGIPLFLCGALAGGYAGWVLWRKGWVDRLTD